MATGRTLTLRQFRERVLELKEQLGRGSNSVVLLGLHAGLGKALAEVHKATDNAPPASPNGAVGAVNTGGYKAAWQVEYTPTGGRITNRHPASDVIEDGRRAGARRPPIAAIEQWARRRLQLSPKEARAAAFPIANAIAKRGLTGRRVLTSPKMVRRITTIVTAEIKRELKAAIRKKGR